MKPGLRIAEGGPANVAQVISITERSFDPAYGEGWTGPQCAGLLPMAGVWISLAWMDEDAVGFALGRSVLSEAELLLLAVIPEHRQCGLGARLLDRFQDIACERGATRLHLEMRDGNKAINLYRRRGFREVGRRRDYYSGSDGQLFDALTLAMSIDSQGQA